MITKFANSFTSGEIVVDAQDRNDIQPIAKGCSQATNMLVTIPGPLTKRRGFWNIGPTTYQADAAARLVPFRRSIDDALMLEMGDLTCRVWLSNGSPLLNGAAQVQFAIPWTAAQLPGLRYKQIGDVIYFRHATGLPPYTLTRGPLDSNWTLALETFVNGPWQPENIDQTKSLTFTGTTITSVNTFTDPSGNSPPKAILAGNAVSIVASAAVFDVSMVGGNLRIRVNTGTGSIRSWGPGVWIATGWFILSVGNIYLVTATGGDAQKGNATTPPVQLSGYQSDGCNMFQFLHDGAGIVKILSVTDSTHATGTVLSTLPVGSGQATSYFAEQAYGGDNGWPRAWPSSVEERLISGATTANLDILDLSRIAGFKPASEDYHPGLGTGQVVDTDALRRRLGDDGAQILWTRPATYLIVGTAAREYIVSGGLFGEPMTPSTIIVRELSDFGSEDVYPAKCHKGLVWVCRGGMTLRKISLDQQQGASNEDLSYLAGHIMARQIKQLAWLPQPDENLYMRLGDGGFAVLTMHDEQQVRGFTSQSFQGGWAVQDIVTLPGPGRFETMWMIVSRVKAGVQQRVMLMQSQRSDQLYQDFAALYAGPPHTVIGGLGMFEGETMRTVADGAMVPDQAVLAGNVTLGVAASRVTVGYSMPVTFTSNKLDLMSWGGELNARERISSMIVSVNTALCKVGWAGAPLESVSGRGQADLTMTGPHRVIKQVTVAQGSSRDPRLTITEDTPYDFSIVSLRPLVAGGGIAGV